jgi:lycopene beta-cyclase
MHGPVPIRRRAAGGDIAILGGGLAGLSLALQLVARGVSAPIDLIEPRTRYDDDRTWCFWDGEAHPFAHLVANRWPAWRVSTQAGTTECRSHRVAYARLPSDAVYADALARLARAPNVRLHRGVRVHARAGRQVDTDLGRLAPDLVFDGRPPTPAEVPGDGLLQQFVGRRVALDGARLDPACCELMDFRVAQDLGIAFLYVLPLGPGEALVELTLFAARAQPQAALERRLDGALADRFGAGGWRALGREHGAIPMHPGLGQGLGGGDQAIPIGTRAGAPRPATGYAFLPIQRHSAALADRVAAGAPAPVAMRPASTLWLDRVFLGRLMRHPEAGPDTFQALFARVPADRLVRFLMERDDWVDRLSVMAALPTLPFAREALAPRIAAVRP